jgi:low molecular weight protein-tyrosine phosphatase
MRRFTILAVCTANICRSPVMEILFRDRLDPARFEVASAGVRGWNAAPIDSMVVLELARLGHAATAHRSRVLDVHHVEQADLVLTAAREHRGAVLALSPRALRKTFTLREFAALVENSNPTSLEELVQDASRRRSMAPIDIDVLDPFMREPAMHHRVADEIAAAVDVVASRLSDLPARGTVVHGR